MMSRAEWWAWKMAFAALITDLESRGVTRFDDVSQRASKLGEHIRNNPTANEEEAAELSLVADALEDIFNIDLHDTPTFEVIPGGKST